MKTHELKTWEEFYSDVESGRKSFELRLNDRFYEVGDLLHLREWSRVDERYTGRSCMRRVVYLLKDIQGIERGYCILGLEMEYPP